MSNRWRPEAKLAERLYREARPYLTSLSASSTAHTLDSTVRDALCDGEWAYAVVRMLYLGWQPDPRTREEITRMWCLESKGIQSDMQRALRFASTGVQRSKRAGSATT